VPVANRIGEEGQGWTYAKYLLQFERGNAYAPGLTHQLEKVKTIASAEVSDMGEPLIRDRDFRRKLADMLIKVEAINATELKLFAGRTSGEAMGPVSSMLKLEARWRSRRSPNWRLRRSGLRRPVHRRHLGVLKRRRQRTAPRPRLRRPDRADVLQLPQDLDLRRLQRDPAQHHGQDDPGAVAGGFGGVRSPPVSL